MVHAVRNLIPIEPFDQELTKQGPIWVWTDGTRPKTYGPGDPACDDAAFAIIFENFDEEKFKMLELRRQRIQ